MNELNTIKELLKKVDKMDKIINRLDKKMNLLEEQNSFQDKLNNCTNSQFLEIIKECNMQHEKINKYLRDECSEFRDIFKVIFDLLHKHEKSIETLYGMVYQQEMEIRYLINVQVKAFEKVNANKEEINEIREKLQS